MSGTCLCSTERAGQSSAIGRFCCKSRLRQGLERDSVELTRITARSIHDGERFGLKPERLAADTAYGAAPMLNWLVEEKQIAPHIPVFDRSKREDGTFSREDFRYDEATDTYTCPAEKTLSTSGTVVNDGTTRLYIASTRDCAPCPLKTRCCPKTPLRRVPRSIYERARDVARSWVGTEAFEQSRRERKRIEMRFAHLKRILRLDRKSTRLNSS